MYVLWQGNHTAISSTSSAMNRFRPNMNTSGVSHHEVSPTHFTTATIQRYYEQTQGALVACNAERVTVDLHSTFLNIHQSSVLTVTLVTVLFGCYVVGVWYQEK